MLKTIYQDGSVFCYLHGTMGKSFALAGLVQGRTLWCDGSKISCIDGQAFRSAGTLVMLGSAGLIMTMPGTAGAHPKQGGAEFEMSFDASDNNNNNNNING